MRFVSIAVLIIAATGTSVAADIAVLRNGNSIRHEHKEVLGTVTRLYLGSINDGYVEIPTDQIDHFERDTSPTPAHTSAPAAGSATLQRSTPTKPLQQQALTTEGLNDVVSSASAQNQIDPDFIRSVIKAESGFHQNAISKKGALGLMQLMPGTASQLGVTNPFDPHSNVDGGTKYLRDLLVKYNFDVNKALAAYNAGPKRVEQYHGVPPYYETQAYISRIIRDFNRQKIAKNPALAKKQPASAAKTARSRKSATSRTVPSRAARAQASNNSVAPSVPKGPETASR